MKTQKSKIKTLVSTTLLSVFILLGQAGHAQTPVFFTSFNGGAGGFNGPTGIVVDTRNNILVSDSENNRVQVFNANNVFQQTFTGDLFRPNGIALEPGGTIDVVSQGSAADDPISVPSRVTQFNPNYTLIGSFGAADLSEGFFIAVDSAGNKYVTEGTSGATIKKFDSNGNFIQTFPPPPTQGGGVVLSKEGIIYAADTSGQIQRFTTDGVFLSTFAQFPSASGISFGSDALYVVDELNNRIFILNLDGTVRATFGSSGSGAGQFNQPFDVFVDESTGKIYVSDRGNNRVQVWLLKALSPVGLDTTALVSYSNANRVSTSLQSQMELLLQKSAAETWACAQTSQGPGIGFAEGIESASPDRLSTFRHLVGQRRALALNPEQAHRPLGRKRHKLISTYEVQAHTPPVSQRIQLGRANLWLQNYGQIQNLKGSSSAPGFRGQMGGFSVGGDYEIGKKFFVGAFGGLSTNPYDVKDHFGSGRVKSYYGGVYGVKMWDRGLYVDGQFMAGGDHYHTKRKLGPNSTHPAYVANHNGGQLFTKAEIGQIEPLSRLVCVPRRFDVMLQPFVNVAYALNREAGFTEKGQDGFKVKSRHSNFIRSEAGLLVYKTYMFCDVLLFPEISVSYINTSRVGGGRGKVKGNIVGQSQIITAQGNVHTINQVAPEVGLTAQFKNGAYILANTRGELGRRLNSLSGLVTLGYNF